MRERCELLFLKRGCEKSQFYLEIIKKLFCSREDSNLHGITHTLLRRTRLPISPRELVWIFDCATDPMCDRFTNLLEKVNHQ